MSSNFMKVLKEAITRQQNGEAFVLATIVQGEEGSPGRTGFKVVVFDDGSFEGTVGGGLMEKLILEKCAEIHKTGQNCLVEMELTERGIGVICGGNATVYFEYYEPTKTVYLFGAGHTCRSISPILKSVLFKVVVIDNRKEFAQKELLPAADEVCFSDYLEYLSSFKPNKTDAVIIFTHGHIHDEEILDKLCEKNIQVKYLGMIGSKVKVKDTKQNIQAKKYSGNLIDNIYAPIGLNVAKRTTEEIAIAVVAEILAVYNNVENLKFMSKK